jgi:hypothetical protein
MVKQVELAIRSQIDEIVRPVGLTAAQYTALTVLERHDNMSSAQLARYSFVTAQSMADMITTLEARTLIERHRDNVDRRRGGRHARPLPRRNRRPGSHDARRAVRRADEGAAGGPGRLLCEPFQALGISLF